MKNETPSDQTRPVPADPDGVLREWNRVRTGQEPPAPDVASAIMSRVAPGALPGVRRAAPAAGWWARAAVLAIGLGAAVLRGWLGLALLGSGTSL
jgi:hypothetical protein